MLLVIDIGNSNIVLGIFRGSKLEHSWRVATRLHSTADEYALLCRNLFPLSDLSASEVKAIVISSVVPPLNEYFKELSQKYFKISPIFVEPEKQNLMPIRYHPVSDVGADRIVAAIAARTMSEGPIIVVDFGTATTFDAISADGEYLGGIIAPGIGISAEALFIRAARLPRIEIKRPSRTIGGSTVASMQSGIYFGYVALVEGILNRMKAELGSEAYVIATGGFARTIGKEIEAIDRIEHDLMLLGLRHFYERMQGSASL